MQFYFPTSLNLGQEHSEGFHQELLRGLTHKLNNLLAVIQGFSSLILMQEDLDPNVSENIQHIREASVGVTNLSERIRSAGGCAKISPQSLGLNEYLPVIEGAVLEPFQKEGVQLEADVQAGLPPVLVDPTKFKEVYIPSAGHDAGISMGSAYWVEHMVAKQQRSEAVFNANTGCHYTNEYIKAECERMNLSYRELSDEDLYPEIVKCLTNGGVVGWFNGPAEFGPRALGGRSIIADPRRTDAKEILNLKIKRRESFRPFAPSILKEEVINWFELDEPVPFMEKVFPIIPEKQKEIPAVTHVDGTGRLQTVNKEVSPRYYALIDRFREKTGVPILLNTSFNENEPIVNTPAEALDCFLRTQMDMLVLENCIIVRE